MRIRIKELKQQLQSIKQSEAYKTISSIKNWDEYFSNTKENLTQQLNNMEDERK